MKASAIVYSSNTGFTERYARMLGDRTGLPVYDLAGGDLPERGTEIVYLGWLMAGMVKGLGKAGKRWKLRAVAAVGMSPAGVWEEASVREKYAGAQVFYLQGGLAPDRLSGLHRFMVSLGGKAMAKELAGEGNDAQVQQAFTQGCDLVDAEQLEPVIHWLNGNG